MSFSGLNVPVVDEKARDLSPVVQIIVSLTSSLRGHFVKCFATL